MRRPSLLALSLACVATLLAGCAGYHLGPVKPKRYENIHTIAVQNFKNQTLEPRLEVLMANTLIKQIQQDGTYKVVSEKTADAILETDIEELDRRPARNRTGNVLLAREYTLIIRVRYRFYRRDNGQVLESRSVQGQTSFFTSGTSIGGGDLIEADVNQDERQAVPLAVEDLAVRLTSQITEGW